MRLNPNDPQHRKLLERSQSGRKTLQEYEKSLLTKSSPLELIDESHRIPNIKDSNQTNDTRDDKVKTLISPSYNKYKNIKTVDEETGLKFDSKFELICWRILRNYEDRGLIFELKRQKSYKLIINDQLICTIRPDFEFVYDDSIITADAKSAGTQGSNFRIKQKLFKSLYNREIIVFTKQMTVDNFFNFPSETVKIS